MSPHHLVTSVPMSYVLWNMPEEYPICLSARRSVGGGRFWLPSESLLSLRCVFLFQLHFAGTARSVM